MSEAVAACRFRRGAPLALSLLACASTALCAEADVARQILEATGVKGGLIVHLGCGEGRLTAALRANESIVVHGLDADAADVAKARANARKLGVYGPVSIERFGGKRLPYADNLVNLVVSSGKGQVSSEEIARVLAPGGRAAIRSASSLDTRPGRRRPALTLDTRSPAGLSGWTLFTKPIPQEIDEWTHYLHDASGNAVARDTVVGPPRHVQWIAEPRHTRSHEHIPSLYALVSTGGRIFYIADEAPVVSLRRTPKWQLIARDAYNGMFLWKRPVPAWFPHIVNWGATPPDLQRRLVAVGDRVYVTLGIHAPVSVVDAATGKTLKTLDQTAGTEEIILHDGILVVAVRAVTEERTAELARWAQLVKQKDTPLRDRDTALPVLKRFRGIDWKAPRSVLALDAETGRVLWKKTGTEASGLRNTTLSAVGPRSGSAGDRVIYQKGRDVVCLDLKTGRQRWATPATALRVVCDRCVVCADGKTVTALSAETGKSLWTQPSTLCSVRDAFVIDGAVWLGGFKPFQGRTSGKRGPAWGPYFAAQHDLTTGKVLKEIAQKNPGHHHRCWRNKATERYILGGRRGVEFLDLESGDVLWHSWVRGVCRYGVMPSNGLLYAPPHSCGCYIAAKLTGFYALAPSGSDEGRGTRDEQTPRLGRGPAYGSSLDTRHSTLDTSTEWPTYRHDAARSGATAGAVAASLKVAWQAEVGPKLTAPTVAAGKVFVASVGDHRVCAVDARSGEIAWQFTAGARVDSPPTLHQGRALFGCRDGSVYSLRAADGALAWRLRAARVDRRVLVCGQLEAASPVHGSVLVRDGVAYTTAGRSSYLDGGIDLCRIETETGKLLSTTPIYSPDPKTGKQPDQFGPCFMPGALGEILSSDGRYVYLRDTVFDKQGAAQPKGDPHLFTMTGFLDDTWPHRSYWMFGTRPSMSTGCSGRDRNLIHGRVLVVSGPMVYGYGRKVVHWSNQLQDGPYRLFAHKRGETKKQWEKRVPIHVRAMVLAGGVLFAVGPPADAVDRPEGPAGTEGAVLLALSAADGSELSRTRLDALPVFDGMAAAGGRLYVSLENGRLACLSK